MEEVNKFEAVVERAKEKELSEFIPKKFILKVHQRKADILEQCGEIECNTEAGTSTSTFSQLRKNLIDIKKAAKEEHDAVSKRIGTAQQDLAD